MLFNSFEFLFFFGSVLLAYRALPPPFRRTLLLAASYVFYMAWEAWYGFLLFGVTLTSWLAALAMERCPGRARAALWAGIAGHLGVMFAFKYYGFFVENTARLLGSLRMGWNAPLLEVLLPVGISFYVFQSMGYMIDVYRRQVAAERSLAAHMLYIAFFPQLIAGPIERAARLGPQLKADHPFDARKLTEGLALIAAGLFKKVVLAENLSILVTTAFIDPAARGGLSLFLGAVMARYMIFCDIAGYTDIALGCGKTFGIELSPNFARPFAARNISEYWQRWHMTLSGWFRDYVFYSLAAGPLSRLGVPALVAATFVLLGLWHGASWNFVLWGLLNGVLMIAYLKVREKNVLPVPDALKTSFTFLAMVSLPTVLVATRDLPQAAEVFRRIFGLADGGPGWADVAWMFRQENAAYLLSSIGFAAALEWLQKVHAAEPLPERMRRWPAALRGAVWLGVALAAALSLWLIRMRDRDTEFLYFQF